jgi:hypothetical protein
MTDRIEPIGPRRDAAPVERIVPHAVERELRRREREERRRRRATARPSAARTATIRRASTCALSVGRSSRSLNRTPDPPILRYRVRRHGVASGPI